MNLERPLLAGVLVAALAIVGARITENSQTPSPLDNNVARALPHDAALPKRDELNLRGVTLKKSSA